MYNFKIELLSKASYVDSDSCDNKEFLCTAYVIKLNHEALNEYIKLNISNSRELYETNEELEAYQAQKEQQRSNFNAKICNVLGIELSENQSVCINQSLTEIFTVVTIQIC